MQKTLDDVTEIAGSQNFFDKTIVRYQNKECLQLRSSIQFFPNVISVRTMIVHTLTQPNCSSTLHWTSLLYQHSLLKKKTVPVIVIVPIQRRIWSYSCLLISQTQTTKNGRSFPSVSKEKSGIYIGEEHGTHA